jgi:hypothetical protein
MLPEQLGREEFQPPKKRPDGDNEVAGVRAGCKVYIMGLQPLALWCKQGCSGNTL